jgi:hypothetical protein
LSGGGSKPRIPDAQVQAFLTGPGGTGPGGIDFGHIAPEVAALIGRPPGPIRLQRGIPGPKGFGHDHIATAEGRLTQMARLGYPDCAAFVHAVARNFQRIGEGGAPNRLALVFRHQGHDLQIIVQHATAGFWGVTTALPYRVARCRLLWEASRMGGSESPPRLAEAPRFETLSLPKPAKGPGGSGS